MRKTVVFAVYFSLHYRFVFGGFKTVVFCLELFYKILDFRFVILYLCIVGRTENNYYLNLNFFKL